MSTPAIFHSFLCFIICVWGCCIQILEALFQSDKATRVSPLFMHNKRFLFSVGDREFISTLDMERVLMMPLVLCQIGSGYPRMSPKILVWGTRAFLRMFMYLSLSWMFVRRYPLHNILTVIWLPIRIQLNGAPSYKMCK